MISGLCVVFFQHKRSCEIAFYMKGADAVMTSIVQYSDWLEEEVKPLCSIIFLCTVSQHSVVNIPL